MDNANKQTENMNNYSKGITLSAQELKALDMAIEMKINNSMTGNGCNPERFEILRGIRTRLQEATK
jgi:hypothetical protein